MISFSESVKLIVLLELLEQTLRVLRNIQYTTANLCRLHWTRGKWRCSYCEVFLTFLTLIANNSTWKQDQSNFMQFAAAVCLTCDLYDRMNYSSMLFSYFAVHVFSPRVYFSKFRSHVSYTMTRHNELGAVFLWYWCLYRWMMHLWYRCLP